MVFVNVIKLGPLKMKTAACDCHGPFFLSRNGLAFKNDIDLLYRVFPMTYPMHNVKSFIYNIIFIGEGLNFN